MKRVITLLLIFFVAFFACNEKKEHSKSKPVIVTTIFPIYDFTRYITKDKMDVFLILPPGTEAHAFEPTAKDIAQIEQSDALIYSSSYLEAWADKISKSLLGKKTKFIDLSKNIKLKENSFLEENHQEHNHTKNVDPHYWLDFDNDKIMVEDILNVICSIDSVNKEFYISNANELKAKIEKLDEKYRNAFKACKKKIFVTGGHATFGYLVDRYNIKYIALAGFSPESEPGTKEVMHLIRQIKKNGLKYIFLEELVSTKMAETISQETGVEILMVYSGHNILKTDLERNITFLDLMARNLEIFKKGMQCE